VTVVISYENNQSVQKKQNNKNVFFWTRSTLGWSSYVLRVTGKRYGFGRKTLLYTGETRVKMITFNFKKDWSMCTNEQIIWNFYSKLPDFKQEVLKNKNELIFFF
jgi:hypothetical protein